MSDTEACENTDREIWRERPGDAYSDSIHVTKGGGIGINCGGRVIVMNARFWHRLAVAHFKTLEPPGYDRGEATPPAHSKGEG